MTKILLVEDNALNRDMLSRRLVRHGYEVVMAVDGAEGVAMALLERPDLILLDLGLPVMDGREAARRIRQQEAVRCVPIIALTAHALQGEREEARAAGCDDYDTKPVELPRLLEKIRNLLGGGG